MSCSATNSCVDKAVYKLGLEIQVEFPEVWKKGEDLLVGTRGVTRGDNHKIQDKVAMNLMPLPTNKNLSQCNPLMFECKVDPAAGWGQVERALNQKELFGVIGPRTYEIILRSFGNHYLSSF